MPISGIGRLCGVADEVLRRSHLKEDKCSGKFNEKVNSYRDVNDAVRSPCRCFVAYDIGVWEKSCSQKPRIENIKLIVLFIEDPYMYQSYVPRSRQSYSDDHHHPFDG